CPPSIGASSELYLTCRRRSSSATRDGITRAGQARLTQINTTDVLIGTLIRMCDNRVEPGYPHEEHLRAHRSIASCCHHIACGCDNSTTLLRSAPTIIELAPTSLWPCRHLVRPR